MRPTVPGWRHPARMGTALAATAAYICIRVPPGLARYAGGAGEVKSRRSGRTAGQELGKGPPRPSGGELSDERQHETDDEKVTMQLIVCRFPRRIETKGIPETCIRPAARRQGGEQMTEPR